MCDHVGDRRRRARPRRRHRGRGACAARPSRSGSSSSSAAAPTSGRAWRGCAPRPTEADAAAQRPAAQRAPARRHGARRRSTRSGVVGLAVGWSGGSAVHLRRRARPLGRRRPRQRRSRWAGSSCRCCSAGSTRPSTRVRFATFAVPRRQLLAGLLAAALVGIPGVVVSVLALTTTITWSRSPQAVAVAVVAAVVAVLTCVTLSRVSTSGLSALGQSRRGREMASAAGGLLFVVGGARQRVDQRAGQPAGPDRLRRLGAGLDAVRPGLGRARGRRGRRARHRAGATGARRPRARRCCSACGTCCCAGRWRTPARSARAPGAAMSAPGGSPACRALRRAPSPHARSRTGAATRATSSRSG